MSNTITRNGAVTPIGVTTPAHSTVWYPCHEGTGTTLEDIFGNGPDLTVSGTTADIWDNAGAISPNATDVKAIGANAYINTMCNLATLQSAGGVIRVGFNITVPAAAAAARGIIQWGRSSAAIGGWGIEINGSDQPIFALRNDAAGSVESSAFGRSISDTYSTIKNVLMEIFFQDANTINGYIYVTGTTVASMTTPIDVTGDTLPVASTDGFTFMARRTAAATWDRFAGVGTEQINNLFIQRRTTYDPTLGAAAFADMEANHREFPASLRS